MTMTTAIRTDASLLRLLWLASPALPIGGFSYSEGLEAAVDAERVTNEAQAADWLVEQLRLTLSRCDLAVIAQVLREPSRADALDDWVRRTRETAELRLQTEQMGRSLMDVLGTPAARTYPVAFALAAANCGAPVREVLLAFAFGWAENMMQAAIKAVPLGQSAGQRILSRLASAIPGAVDHALSLGDDEPQSFAPMLAILSSRHETQYSRLFRS
jgi:urease accessory protein